MSRFLFRRASARRFRPLGTGGFAGGRRGGAIASAPDAELAQARVRAHP